MRFDEIELETVPLMPEAEAEPLPPESGAPRARRLLALLTDLSLFAAVSLALAPLLPEPAGWAHLVALGGFVTVVSYYYFVGSWLLWGKTIGGAIFDVRVVPADAAPMSLSNASWRWAGVVISLLGAGAGFALAALPARLSLADRVSNTRSV
ncbi:MAG TPA: RDD family protein [Thermoanaerobaculia bacterium]